MTVKLGIKKATVMSRKNEKYRRSKSGGLRETDSGQSQGGRREVPNCFLNAWLPEMVSLHRGSQADYSGTVPWGSGQELPGRWT